MSVWVKICGIRDIETARSVAALGPDAVGLNFYADSPRAVPPAVARKIVAELPSSVTPVGVFVNHPPADVHSTCEHVGLTTVQIHGDETPEMIAELHGLEVIRAVRVAAATLGDVAALIERIAEAGVPLNACLVDAHVPGAYGGTGTLAPWKLLAEGWDRTHWPPLILAGGLNPDNVADAVRTVRPWGVDVASGVETAPGEKDLDRVARFIAAVRGAVN